MTRWVTALVAGVLLGVLAMLTLARLGPQNDPSPDKIVRDIADAPKMAEAVAQKHRDEHYINVGDVEELMALPTAFARSEAMYALAGRSDSADVQNLIFETNRVADDVERARLLNVLFFRLAETDPQSALALARTDHFSAIRSIEQTVWHAWARKDFEDAVFAAKAQTSVAHRNSAAQSLYAAFGYMGNETTERIEHELGVGPDRSTRARYLYQLADESPAEAIAFINRLERSMEQQEYVHWLAYYVSLRDPAAALGYADLFDVAADGERYSSIINGNLARENPRATLDRLMLASGHARRSSREFHSAIRALASADLDAAKQYFEQAGSTDDRRIFGSAIALELAKKDPMEALAWARENDKEHFGYLQMSVLGLIAETDPDLALAEALSTPNTPMRSNVISNVVQRIARTNPADAVAYLEQIQDRQQKLEVSRQLASAWIYQDADAAIDWILGQDKESAEQMIQATYHRLVASDVNAAIRLLPRLEGPNQQVMRQQIAQKLAIERSVGEAQNFIRRFDGQPGYDQLQASVISGVARTDALIAKQLADQLVDPKARNTAYVQVVAQHAQANPAEATRWLRNITDESMRGAAAGQLAAHWHANDPAAAERWVSGLPAGSVRDDAILQMSYRWRDPTRAQEALVASIEDRDKRGQAKIRQVYNLMRTDPARARELLEDEDIPDYKRQQVERTLSQQGLRY